MIVQRFSCDFFKGFSFKSPNFDGRHEKVKPVAFHFQNNFCIYFNEILKSATLKHVIVKYFENQNKHEHNSHKLNYLVDVLFKPEELKFIK